MEHEVAPAPQGGCAGATPGGRGGPPATAGKPGRPPEPAGAIGGCCCGMPRPEGRMCGGPAPRPPPPNAPPPPEAEPPDPGAAALQEQILLAVGFACMMILPWFCSRAFGYVRPACGAYMAGKKDLHRVPTW